MSRAIQTDSVRRQFGPNAEKYARAAYFAGGDSLDEMMRVVQPQRGWRALDVATGGGHCALAFAPHVGSIIATDVTPEMLIAAEGVARERGLSNISFEPADAEALPYDDGAFDLVTCRIAAHHFSDPGQAVREFARVVGPGGLVGLIDPIVPHDRRVADEINAWDLVRDPSHVACLTVNGWSALFCAAGLDAVHIDTFDVPLDFEDLVMRSGCTPEVITALRRGLLQGSEGMRAFLQPQVMAGRLRFVWPQILIIGRRGRTE
jgi:ubiquinone/menaquinone biosynthesis C-methylase UbiE